MAYWERILARFLALSMLRNGVSAPQFTSLAPRAYLVASNAARTVAQQVGRRGVALLVASVVGGLRAQIIQPEVG